MSMAGCETALLLLAGSLAASDHGLRAALQLTSKRLYVYFADLPERVDVELLNVLSRAFDVVAVEAPVLDVVPLLAAAGWTAENVAGLADVQTVVVTADGRDAAESLLALRSTDAAAPPVRVVQPSQLSAAAGEASSVEVSGPAAAFPVPRAAVGGTFDRLHAGHRMLLAVTAVAASECVYVGVTGERLLAGKRFAELLQSYEAREAAVQRFLRAVRPGLKVVTGALLDPKARTQAAADAGMCALVLSRETLAGGRAINADREGQGFRALTLVIVNLLGQGSGGPGGEKLSSTALRAAEARARARA